MKIISIVGRKNSGKTTLIERLIPLLRGRGLKVAVIKHDAHDFSIDREGKDTWRFHQAGADEVVIGSSTQLAVMRNLRSPIHPKDILPLLDSPDIVILEGYKRLDFPKIAVLAAPGQLEEMGLSGDHGMVVAAVVRGPEAMPANPALPVFTFDQLDSIADFAFRVAHKIRPVTMERM